MYTTPSGEFSCGKGVYQDDKKQKNAGCMCRTALFYLPEHANEHDRTGKQY